MAISRETQATAEALRQGGAVVPHAPDPTTAIKIVKAARRLPEPAAPDASAYAIPNVQPEPEVTISAQDPLDVAYARQAEIEEAERRGRQRFHDALPAPVQDAVALAHGTLSGPTAGYSDEASREVRGTAPGRAVGRLVARGLGVDPSLVGDTEPRSYGEMVGDLSRSDSEQAAELAGGLIGITGAIGAQNRFLARLGRLAQPGSRTARALSAFDYTTPLTRGQAAAQSVAEGLPLDVLYASQIEGDTPLSEALLTLSGPLAAAGAGGAIGRTGAARAARAERARANAVADLLEETIGPPATAPKEPVREINSESLAREMERLGAPREAMVSVPARRRAPGIREVTGRQRSAPEISAGGRSLLATGVPVAGAAVGAQIGETEEDKARNSILGFLAGAGGAAAFGFAGFRSYVNREEVAKARKAAKSAGVDPDAYAIGRSGTAKLGEITPEIGRAIKRQAGEIRLRNERAFHMQVRHGDIFGPGKINPSEFAEIVAGDFDRIYQGKSGTLILARMNEQAPGQMLYVELTPADGGYWDIGSGHILSRKSRLREEDLLWERARQRSAGPGLSDDLRSPSGSPGTPGDTGPQGGSALTGPQQPSSNVATTGPAGNRTPSRDLQGGELPQRPEAAAQPALPPADPAAAPQKPLRRRIADLIDPERAQETEVLRRQATTDPLTGALNKRGDNEAVEQALTERRPGTRLVRMRLDMDNFKALNDTQGHDAGDRALQVVTAALKGTTRPDDLVSLGRVGGDEFAITLRVAEGADPAVIRDRLETAADAALEKAGLADLGDRRVSTSIGFAEAAEGMSGADLDRLADEAAIARKAERGVSRPRESVTVAAGGQVGAVQPREANPLATDRSASPRSMLDDEALSEVAERLPKGDGTAAGVDPDDFVNVGKFALDPAGEKRLRDEVTRIVQEQGLSPKQTVSWAETRRIAKSIGIENLKQVEALRLTGPEMLAIRNIVKSNTETIEHLARRVHTGLDDAGTPLAAEEVERAARTLQALEEQNDALLSKFIRARTQTGRDLNNLKILASNTLDPVTWLSRAQRLAGGPLPIEIKAELRGLIREVQMGTKTKEDLVRYVAGLRKAPWHEKLTTAWKSGLLTGLGTHLANLTGNTTMAVLEASKDAPAYLFDRLLSLRTGVRMKDFSPRALARASTRGAWKGTKEALDVLGLRDAWRELQGGNLKEAGRRVVDAIRSPDVRGALEKYDYRDVNFNNAFLDVYVKAPFKALTAGDRIFRNIALQRSLEEQARVLARMEGLKGDALKARAREIVQAPPDEIAIQAMHDAETATFVSAGRFARALSGIKRPLGPLGEFIVPFSRTPANIAERVVEYSPLGPLTTIPDVVKLFSKATRKSEIPAIQRRIVETLGRATVGSAALSPLVAGYLLAEHGLMTAGYPEDANEREIWQQSGRQENSVLIDGKWRSVERLSPLGNLMALGAHLHQVTRDPELTVGGKAASAAGAIGKSVLELSPLTGVQGMLDAVKEPERKAQKYIEQTAGSVVPSWLAGIARSTDPVVRDPKGITEAVQARIPGLSQRVAPRIDVLGDEVRREEGFLANVADPFNPRTDLRQGDRIRAELDRLGIGISRSRQLEGESDADFHRRQTDEGRALRQALEATLASESYANAEALAREWLERFPEETEGWTLEELATEHQRQLLTTAVRDTRRWLIDLRKKGRRYDPESGDVVPTAPPWGQSQGRGAHER